MFRFFKKDKELPPFPDLQSSAIKDNYFTRVCQWRWLDRKSIAVSDKYQPRVITLDPWPQLVFLEATGERTVKEFVYYMAEQYSGAIPPELDKQILTEIDSLLKERIIEIRETKTSLPKDILGPISS